MPFTLLLFFCLLTHKAQAEESLIIKIQKAQQSMVEVRTELTKIMRTDKSDRSQVREATFSRSAAGIIIDPQGLIVTNTHTVLNAPAIFVILSNGKRYKAHIAYTSPTDDFCFIRIYPPRPLKAIGWADSSKAQLGERVIAIGNSSLNNQALLSGSITGLLQSKTSGDFEFLQLNLELFHGDSGGPIFNAQGKLLGIVMGKRLSQDRVSLAIASNKIRLQYWQYLKNMQ